MKHAYAGAGVAIGAVLLLGLLTPRRAEGQLFGWSVVFDPQSYATLGKIWDEDISMGAKLIQEYNQLVKIYSTNYQLYSAAMTMSRQISHPNRMMWTTALQTAVNDYTRDKYGETAAWPTMINGVPSLASAAWSSATIPIPSFPATPTDPRLLSRLMARIAGVEIADGSSSKCLQVVAQYRQNTAVNRNAVASLSAAQTNDGASINTYMAQANLLNAAQAQSLNEARAQGQVNTCLAEQQIIANKAVRDAQADSINYSEAAAMAYQSQLVRWDGTRRSAGSLCPRKDQRCSKVSFSPAYLAFLPHSQHSCFMSKPARKRSDGNFRKSKRGSSKLSPKVSTKRLRWWPTPKRQRVTSGCLR